jgi:hypothetical protein
MAIEDPNWKYPTARLETAQDWRHFLNYYKNTLKGWTNANTREMQPCSCPQSNPVLARRRRIRRQCAISHLANPSLRDQFDAKWSWCCSEVLVATSSTS